MLTALRLRDFAIAAGIDLELGPGLTVITGETGAGKSILIDALGLLLGGRGNERVVRAGAELAELEARFDGVSDPLVLAALRERGLEPEDGMVLVRRTIGRNGTRKAWIQGRMASSADLRAVVGPLVDLATQHQQNRLLDRRAHLEILDRAGGLQADVASYQRRYAAYAACRAGLAALTEQQRAAEERRDYLQFCADELAQAAVRPGELAALEADVRRLRAAESLLRIGTQTEAALTGDGGARDALAGLPRDLERARRDDPALADFSGRIHDILALIDEAASDLGRWAESVRRDPERLSKAEARMDRLIGLQRKYGGSEEALLQRQAAIDAELEQGAVSTAQLQALQAQLPGLKTEVTAAAQALSAARTAAAEALQRDVEAVLAELGMAKARFSVELRPEDDGEPGPDGQERARFLLQSNPGEPAQGLVEVASGGELSRVLLGLERAASRSAGAATAVYDEVDAGLSGSTGVALGRFLAEVSLHQQLLVISHLPQVAAAADHHLHVSKIERDGRTESRVQVLDRESRLHELARMLGAGESEAAGPGSSAAAEDTGRQHAEALLRKARLGVARPPVAAAGAPS